MPCLSHSFVDSVHAESFEACGSRHLVGDDERNITVTLINVASNRGNAKNADRETKTHMRRTKPIQSPYDNTLMQRRVDVDTLT